MLKTHLVSGPAYFSLPAAPGFKTGNPGDVRLLELRRATVLVSIPTSQKMAAFSFPRNGKELSDMLIFALSQLERTLFSPNLRRQGSIEPNISTSHVCHSQLPAKDSQLQMTWQG